MKNLPFILLAALMLYACGIGLGYADTPQDIQLGDVSRLPIGRGQAAVVEVLHDRVTGCEYLAWEAAYTQGGAITPRMAPDGKQLCRKP